MMRLTTLASVLACAAAQSTLLWNQHEDTAVYTSAGLSLKKGTTPTFATATWLNNPIYVEVCIFFLLSIFFSITFVFLKKEDLGSPPVLLKNPFLYRIVLK